MLDNVYTEIINCERNGIVNIKRNDAAGGHAPEDRAR
jgi:hypothetical protein